MGVEEGVGGGEEKETIKADRQTDRLSIFVRQLQRTFYGSCHISDSLQKLASRIATRPLRVRHRCLHSHA